MPLRLGEPLGRGACDEKVDRRLLLGRRHGEDAQVEGNRPTLPIREFDRRAEQEASLAQLGQHEDRLLRLGELRDRLTQVAPGAVDLSAAESNPGRARPLNARVLAADRGIAIDALELLDQRLEGRFVCQGSPGVRLGAHALRCFLEGVSKGFLRLHFSVQNAPTPAAVGDGALENSFQLPSPPECQISYHPGNAGVNELVSVGNRQA